MQEDEHTAANVARKIPVVGNSIATRMEHQTYYQLDTQLMFTSSINSLIMAAVEQVKLDKGFTSSRDTD